jgi:hypothetical protein
MGYFNGFLVEELCSLDKFILEDCGLFVEFVELVLQLYLIDFLNSSLETLLFAIAFFVFG